MSLLFAQPTSSNPPSLNGSTAFWVPVVMSGGFVFSNNTLPLPHAQQQNNPNLLNPPSGFHHQRVSQPTGHPDSSHGINHPPFDPRLNSFGGSAPYSSNINQSQSFNSDDPGDLSPLLPPLPLPTSNDQLSTTFVDTMANKFGFGDADHAYRAGLHGFVQLGRGLPKPDLATRTFLLGAIYSLSKDQRSTAKDYQALRSLVSDMCIRLDDNFSLSKEQQANVRIVVGDTLFDPSRISFMQLHVDVEVILRKDMQSLRLVNIYGNPAREKYLTSHVKRVCSALRNAFREMIRDSIIGDSVQSLDDFVYESAVRLRRDGARDLPAITTARLAILRRFAFNHQELLGFGEDDNDPTSADISPGTSGNTLDTPGSGSRSSSRSSSLSPLSSSPDVSISATTAPKKRKRLLRPMKGHDFWSQVEKWFLAHQARWGHKWTSDGWKQYICETVAEDEGRWKPVVPVNPYMVDAEQEDARLRLRQMETTGMDLSFGSTSDGTAGHMTGDEMSFTDILNAM